MKNILGLRDAAALLTKGTESQRYMKVYRALQAGAFPDAEKLNEGLTSQWAIPRDNVEKWLEKENADPDHQASE